MPPRGPPPASATPTFCAVDARARMFRAPRVTRCDLPADMFLLTRSLQKPPDLRDPGALVSRPSVMDQRLLVDLAVRVLRLAAARFGAPADVRGPCPLRRLVALAGSTELTAGINAGSDCDTMFTAVS